MRSTTSNSGAATPIAPRPGSRPTRIVAIPMIASVTRKVFLRPARSPMRPNTRAPRGRTMKPTAKVASARMKAVVGWTPEKKCAAMYPASEPYRKKSYHSKSVPSAEAPMTWAGPLRSSGIPEEDRQLAHDAVDLLARALEKARRGCGPLVPGRVVAHVELGQRRRQVALGADAAPELGEALAPLLQPEIHPF